MKLTKKYKFEAAYVNSDGIKGSSFEMFITYNSTYSGDEILKSIDDFVDQFDHSTMFSFIDTNKEFLSLSQRTVVVDCLPEEIDFYIYGNLVYSYFSQIDIEKIQVYDGKDTTWTVEKTDTHYTLVK
jgi:hypothetical protein